MTEKDRYIEGVPCWADLILADVDRASAFYAGLFGWDLVEMMPPEVPGSYLTARRDGGDIAAIGTPSPGEAPSAAWRTYVWVDDAEAAVERAVAAGGQVLQPATVVGGDAGKSAWLADPQGAEFGVFQPLRHRGATVVNEHGSVNFNDLHTTDVEGAKAFYGAVFGWETIQLGDAHMWVLPAYADHLELLNPGTIERMREMGAPDRFEEVVASMQPLAEEDAERGAHWGVTFAVDDVDAVAKQVWELGGEVLAGPFDAPWTRTAVVRDPDGTRIVTSQFVPEPAPDAAASGTGAAAA